MSEYNFREIEQKWQQRWEQQQTYKTDIDPNRPKYYALDMFPYPSGAGLHVGHPLGYIASDIVARYKRLRGFNVLHPMGFDSFGLPAEQYAIQTGQHPAVTTEKNIATYISQLKKIGFSYDWSREVRTSDPKFYKWTQWIFMQLFKHYYDKDADKALPISDLVKQFVQSGNAGVNAVCDEDTPVFTAEDWNAMTERQQQEMLLKYRLTMPEESFVNWCPALGSVLSNDEVKDGVSERGGYPVERKLMKQWAMRITAYADRLLNGLDEIDWSDSIKEQQRNWIGRSQGASVKFRIQKREFGEANSEFRKNSISENSKTSEQPDNNSELLILNSEFIEVFTTRVDTIYGVSFMVLAPEHELVASLTTPEQKAEVEAYVKWAAGRSEVDRMAEVKKVTGAFTGSYAILPVRQAGNPSNDEKVPIYIADYVLASYGTGAVMGVPSGDQRDWNFATHFGLPIIPILDSQKDIDKQADATKEGRYINSGMINGMGYKEATETLIRWLEERGLGKGKVQYRLRNAVFSRQRYWGEPVPVYYKDGLPYLIDEADLPLVLPEIDKYLPTETGEPPLGRAENWKYKGQYEYELSTMPGWAGSSWYFYRYMDPQNDGEFTSKETVNYWQDVDLYLGGSEHATGHLLYSRFWNHFLYDLGVVPQKEYAKKLINQGMILGVSQKVYFLSSEQLENDKTLKAIISNALQPYRENIGYPGSREIYFLSRSFVEQHGFQENTSISLVNIPIQYVNKDSILDIDAFTRNAYNSFGTRTIFICEGGIFYEGDEDRRGHYGSASSVFDTYAEVEKMSKSKYNVVNPDDIVQQYGADTLRMYEMFLGPLTEAKPWNTNGISGVHNFLRKFWRLFYNDAGQFIVTDADPTRDELKTLHKTIKKVADDIENYSFNTTVSAFMICVNELSALRCHKRAVLQDLVVILSPYAPHIAEELWERLGHTTSVTQASYPAFNADYLTEDSFEYPISINGKVRTKMTFPAETLPADIEKSVLAEETVQKWLEGKEPKKVIVVPKRIVNVVI